MVQANVNRELTCLEADLTRTDVNEVYITCSISKASSAMHGAEGNNVLPSQTITNYDNEEVLAGTSAALSLLLFPQKIQSARILARVL